jgi:uncharacterized cupredoxin-like copper-binding protein
VTTTADIPRRRRSALVLVALASLGGLAIAGCGGGGGNSSTEATGAAGGGTSGGQSTVDVGETEYKLDPSDPTVKAGTVTFNATNDGSVTHSLEVEGPSGEQELESDLSPGQSGTLTVDLSKPGKYEFYCPIDDHKGMGMTGEITVTGSGGASASGSSSSESNSGGGSGGGGYGGY